MVKLKNKEILLDTGTNEIEIMEFTVADKAFGLNVAKVAEIMTYQKIMEMPNSNEFVEGVFKPRESIMTVIDLAKYLNLPPSENIKRDILLITVFNKINLAFHVHSVKDIHRISWEQIEKPDEAIYGRDFGLATGIARINNRLITIIDFEKIMADISPAHTIQDEPTVLLSDTEKAYRPILIAEDSPLLERLIINSLEKAGFKNIIKCTNGKEAWDKLTEFKNYNGPINEKIACVITDIEMPQMDGHRLTKLIREDDVLGHLPVILFSSLISDEMKIKGESVGATAQITKPEIDRLIQIIDKNI